MMMPVLIDLILLIAGIGALILGGDTLVKGAVTLSLRIGVTPLMVGLTVVAFGTSAPELALNIIAALKDNTPLAFGNIVGSNIANVGLILGFLACLKPMKVNPGLVKREMPIMLAITALTLILAWLGSTTVPAENIGTTNTTTQPTTPWPGLSRLDGIFMLVSFAVFMAWIIIASRQNTTHDPKTQPAGQTLQPTDSNDKETEVDPADADRPLSRAILFIIAGLTLLIAGGQGAEIGASGIAAALGMTPELIGLTVVAVATSLPEFFAGLMAIRRNQVDIAVGNIVGSNIFNLALVLGVTATINPVAVPEGGVLSLIVMTTLALLLIPFSFTSNRTITRPEGLLLLLIYLSYTAGLVYQALG